MLSEAKHLKTLLRFFTTFRMTLCAFCPPLFKGGGSKSRRIFTTKIRYPPVLRTSPLPKGDFAYEKTGRGKPSSLHRVQWGFILRIWYWRLKSPTASGFSSFAKRDRNFHHSISPSSSNFPLAEGGLLFIKKQDESSRRPYSVFNDVLFLIVVILFIALDKNIVFVNFIHCTG